MFVFQVCRGARFGARSLLVPGSAAALQGSCQESMSHVRGGKRRGLAV